jgi:hypothetical protein
MGGNLKGGMGVDSFSGRSLIVQKPFSTSSVLYIHPSLVFPLSAFAVQGPHLQTSRHPRS